MDKQTLPESLTPIPRNQGESITMSFPDAMREVINGKKVARISWGNKDYGFLKGEWLTIFTKGAFHTWSVSQGDLEGEDWMVVIDAKTN
ncbi:MAG: DUF2829 domain-containing protein [Candidatus Curtissbacteria bacterium]|nr:DUF2829 domain-containing protein [Candidatus Curtissbacteria bacterium]